MLGSQTKSKGKRMSKTFKIFTSGKMGGLTFSQQMKWRINLENEVKEHLKKLNNPPKVVFIHPPEFFDYEFPNQDIAKEWEINQLMDSDIAVFNLSNINDSIGTHIELGIVYAVNKLSNKHITTIGIGKPDTDHPWIKTFCCLDNEKEAAEFIYKYLLI